MTHQGHSNNANNFVVVTSYEFSDIISYLNSQITNPAENLPTMKQFSSLNYIEKGNYYTVSQSEAWDYFKKKYTKSIETKRIRDMDDLLNSADEYVKKHKN
jgi:hypothetical protein